jgi:hypothetical protein
LTAYLTGLGLAAAAGLNAWAVLIVAHGLEKILPQEFTGPAAGLLEEPLLFQVALVLFLLEFVVDKIPMVDRVWHLAQTLLRPVAGALLGLACVPAEGWPARIGVALSAAIVTLAMHVAKSTTRLTSTAATKGWTQLAVSLAEDFVAVLLAILVFFVPQVTSLFLVGLVVILLTYRRRVWRGLQVLFFRLQHPRRGARSA